MRTNISPHPPPLDADAPLRVMINTYAEWLAAVTAVACFGGVVVALVLGGIAGSRGTHRLDLPLAVASGLFCLSLPMLLVATWVVQVTAPRRFRYADRRLAATIAALRRGDVWARAWLLAWAADHPIRVRDAMRQHYHPDVLPMVLPLVQDPDPARRKRADVLLDLGQAVVLSMLLPLLEGRRRTAYLKHRIRAQDANEAACIAAYVLGPLRRWNGPPHPPPDAQLLYTLLQDWPALASDDDLRRAHALPDFRREVRWLNRRGDAEQRHRPYAFVAVRTAAAHIAWLRQR